MSRTRPEDLAGVADWDLSGTNVVVTGATDGIGRQTAESLGRLGARVLVHGRDGSKADRVVTSIEDGPGDADRFLADFQDEEEIHELADFALETMDQVDVLVNNAGTYFQDGRLTDAGIERTFAVNHLGPFVLTNRLVPEMSEDGRIVTVASAVHRRTGMDFDAIESVEGYDGFDAYARSKFANILFTYALARRLDSKTSNCLHPGFVPGSALWRETNLPMKTSMALIGMLPEFVQNLVVNTPRTAAVTPVYLAASPAVAGVTGSYFADLEERKSSPETYDEGLQERLWDRSVDLVTMDATDIL